MAVVQKIKIDNELTSNIQVVLRNETGLYNPSNITGYGGNNGFPVTDIQKYLFELKNLDTNEKYFQVQSDDLSNEEEYHNPSLARIANKENVTIHSNNFNKVKFDDGIYNVTMYAALIDVFIGNGYVNTEIIVNVENINEIYGKFQSIMVDDEIYNIQGVLDNNLILDRPIISNFEYFNVLLKQEKLLILSDDVNDYINNSIATMAINNPCNSDNKTINSLVEIQLYYWGIQRSIDQNNYNQAFKLFNLIKSLCNFNCNSNGC